MHLQRGEACGGGMSLDQRLKGAAGPAPRKTCYLPVCIKWSIRDGYSEGEDKRLPSR
jgi:hypothetical protein